MQANDQKWGGEFRGAWEALAAATPRRRASGKGRNDFPGHSTADLYRDMGSVDCDDALRAKIEAEITRRKAKR